MAKETREQRTLREAREAEQALVEREAFRQTMPERLSKLVDRYKSIGVYPDIKLMESGPRVLFDHEGEFYVHSYLTYDSDHWEVEAVEQAVEEECSRREFAKQRFALAGVAWAKLSKDEQSAIREFIRSLT